MVPLLLPLAYSPAVPLVDSFSFSSQLVGLINSPVAIAKPPVFASSMKRWGDARSRENGGVDFDVTCGLVTHGILKLLNRVGVRPGLQEWRRWWHDDKLVIAAACGTQPERGNVQRRN